MIEVDQEEFHRLKLLPNVVVIEDRQGQKFLAIGTILVRKYIGNNEVIEE